MTENTKTDGTVTEQSAESLAPDTNAGIASAAAAESAEIRNLLDDQQSGGCCGGACCS